MVHRLRIGMENKTGAKELSKTFVDFCDQPMPQSVGVCFRDTYLDDQFRSKTKDRNADCYSYFDYDLDLSNYPANAVSFYSGELDLSIRSTYYMSGGLFFVRICQMLLSISREETDRMVYFIHQFGPDFRNPIENIH